MLCAKFGLNWPSGSGVEYFFISSMYFRHFVIISSWKRAESIIWTNLNPHHPKMLVPSLFEIGSVVLDSKIFSICQCIFTPPPPWKKAGPFIWTNLNPPHWRMLCAKFDRNWPSGSEEDDENVKSLQTDGHTDGQTNDGQKVIKKAHELSAQVS